jgi:hypothetical protein
MSTLPEIHRLHGLAAALRIENFERQSVPRENPGALADVGHARVPIAGRADGEFQHVSRVRRGEQQGEPEQTETRHCEEPEGRRSNPGPEPRRLLSWIASLRSQ